MWASIRRKLWSCETSCWSKTNSQLSSLEVDRQVIPICIHLFCDNANLLMRKLVHWTLLWWALSGQFGWCGENPLENRSQPLFKLLHKFSQPTLKLFKRGIFSVLTKESAANGKHERKIWRTILLSKEKICWALFQQKTSSSLCFAFQLQPQMFSALFSVFVQ